MHAHIAHACLVIVTMCHTAVVSRTHGFRPALAAASGFDTRCLAGTLAGRTGWAGGRKSEQDRRTAAQSESPLASTRLIPRRTAAHPSRAPYVGPPPPRGQATGPRRLHAPPALAVGLKPPARARTHGVTHGAQARELDAPRAYGAGAVCGRSSSAGRTYRARSRGPCNPCSAMVKCRHGREGCRSSGNAPRDHGEVQSEVPSLLLVRTILQLQGTVGCT